LLQNGRLLWLSCIAASEPAVKVGYGPFLLQYVSRAGDFAKVAILRMADIGAQRSVVV
jgi:hypothetical protein